LSLCASLLLQAYKAKCSQPFSHCPHASGALPFPDCSPAVCPVCLPVCLPACLPQAYKAKFRNLHFNLKDDKNPDLRRKVGRGRLAMVAVVGAAGSKGRGSRG
jgi:hypothetical protein